MSNVPCPMCCNSQTPGQLDQPREGWPRGEFPEHVMSVPCPMCEASGEISREEWDKMCRPQAEPVVKKEKKPEPSEKIGPSIWQGMKAIREQRKQDWFEEGPFNISDFRKAE